MHTRYGVLLLLTVGLGLCTGLAGCQDDDPVEQEIVQTDVKAEVPLDAVADLPGDSRSLVETFSDLSDVVPWETWLEIGETNDSQEVILDVDTEDISPDQVGSSLDISWCEVSDTTQPASLSIVSPVNLQYVSGTSEGAEVELTVQFVSNCDSLSEAIINYYVDDALAGVLEPGETEASVHVPFGYHVLAAVLAFPQEGGHGELSDWWARDTVGVRVSKPCDGWQDEAKCDDGGPCSDGGCIFDGDATYSCKFGIDVNCCLSDYECSPGQLCSDGACI